MKRHIANFYGIPLENVNSKENGLYEVSLETELELNIDIEVPNSFKIISVNITSTVSKRRCGFLAYDSDVWIYATVTIKEGE